MSREGARAPCSRGEGLRSDSGLDWLLEGLRRAEKRLVLEQDLPGCRGEEVRTWVKGRRWGLLGSLRSFA